MVLPSSHLRIALKAWAISSQGSILVVNVPEFASKDENSHTQHVMNTASGAWCKFSGINAAVFEVFRDKLYFAGAAGSLYVYGDVETDDGQPITGHVKQAYSNFETANVKSFKEMSMLISASSEDGFSANLGVDFEDNHFLQMEYSGDEENLWDISQWDFAQWRSSAKPKRKRIILFSAQGYKGSVGFKVQSKTGNVKWFSTVLSFEEGTGSV